LGREFERGRAIPSREKELNIATKKIVKERREPEVGRKTE